MGETMIFTIGKQIRIERFAKRITQKRLAELLGVSVYTVSRWENDHYKPQGKNLLAIQRVLGRNLYE